MHEFLFYLLSALILFSAVLVVLNRNPVNGAMFMILSLVSLAGMFVLLEAFFLAIIQVLVYAGAVMVLFLFIIMLMDVEIESKRKWGLALAIGAIVAGGLLTVGVIDQVNDPQILPQTELASIEEMPGDNPMAFTTAAKSFGYSLFTKYMLPFQLTGFLLLVAMIGVIVISKQFNDENIDEKEEG